MCGEKTTSFSIRCGKVGSPPHVRGKARRSMTITLLERITPACAGKRARNDAQRLSNRDHPRMCGEKRSHDSGKPVFEGSPPHVRGKVYLRYGYISRNEDHPRMCGEKPYPRFITGCIFGSPPHVRGKVSISRRGGLTGRITPACAGKSPPAA